MSKYAVFFTLKAEAIALAMQQPSDRVAVVSKAVGSCWPGQSIHHRVAPAQLPPRGGARPPSPPWPPPIPGSAALARPPDPPQPVQLRRQRPGAVLQVLQVAVAVEGPAVNVARPAAPVAGLRGARTGVVGPGPAGAAAALVDPRSGLDADLPGPPRPPAAHQASPPLACCQAPTTSASRRHDQAGAAWRALTVLPGGGPAGQGLGPAGDPKARRPARTGTFSPFCSSV